MGIWDNGERVKWINEDGITVDSNSTVPYQSAVMSSQQVTAEIKATL